MPDTAAIDPTTRAIIGFLQLGAVGGMFVLLIMGRFRHEREIEREEKATDEANARTLVVEKQRDAAIAGWQSQTDATRELGNGVKTLHGLVERLLIRNGRSQQ